MSINTENLLRAAFSGYGGGYGGDNANVVSAGILAEGANSRAASELAVRLKQIDAQIAAEAKKLGMTQQQIDEQIRQFGITSSQNQANWEKTFGLQEQKLDWDKSQAKTNTTLGLYNAGQGLPAERTAFTSQYGLTSMPTTSGGAYGTTGTSGLTGSTGSKSSGLSMTDLIKQANFLSANIPRFPGTSGLIPGSPQLNAYDRIVRQIGGY